MSNQSKLAQKYLKDREERKNRNPFGSTEGVKWFKIPGNSTVRLRFLPPIGHDDPNNESLFFRQFGMHWNISAGEKSSFVCPRLTAGSNCPVCEKAFSFRNSVKNGDQSAEEEYKKYKANLRFISQVVDLTGEETYKQGVQLFTYGSTIQTDLLTYLADERNWGDFTDMDEGFVVNITAKGQGPTVKYSVSLDRQNSSFPKEYLNLRVDLDKIITIPTRAELEKALNQQDDFSLKEDSQMSFLPKSAPTSPVVAEEEEAEEEEEGTTEQKMTPPPPSAASSVKKAAKMPKPFAPAPAATTNKSSAIKNFLMNDN